MSPSDQGDELEKTNPFELLHELVNVLAALKLQLGLPLTADRLHRIEEITDRAVDVSVLLERSMRALR